MVHLRIVTPADRTERVTSVLFGDDAVCNVIVLPGAAKQPDGDLVLCDVAREEASVVVSDLRDLGIEEHGSIALEVTESVISKRARHAVRRAEGDEADAVIWEEVRPRPRSQRRSPRASRCSWLSPRASRRPASSSTRRS